LRRKCLVALLILIATLMPFSTLVYAQKSEEKRTEKLIELARRAGERIENFINFIYGNETAITTITDAGLKDELDANRTLFKTWGLGNLTDASIALDTGDFSEANNNATQALSIFREVFKNLNRILEEAEVERGELIDAQGLIIAMKRTVERIERIRSLNGVPEEVLEILDSAEEYLDVETAITWLSEGKANQTAWNLTQANRLISQAYKSLKKKAGELNVKRIESYLKIIGNLYRRNERLINQAIHKGIAKAHELNEKLEAVEELIEEAKAFAAEDHSRAIAKLTDARSRLEQIKRDLLKLRGSA